MLIRFIRNQLPAYPFNTGKTYVTVLLLYITQKKTF